MKKKGNEEREAKEERRKKGKEERKAKEEWEQKVEKEERKWERKCKCEREVMREKGKDNFLIPSYSRNARCCLWEKLWEDDGGNSM